MKIEFKDLSLYLPYELQIANISLKGEIVSFYTMEADNRKDQGIMNVCHGVNQYPVLWPITCFNGYGYVHADDSSR